MAYQPKSYRKFIATAATATMVAGAVAPLASFAATDASGIYKDAVNYLIDKGIASGVDKDTFGVQLKIKRGDAAIMVAKALGVYGTEAKDAGFKDLNDRIAKAVNPLKEKGIISGKTATEFKPDANITRGEMAIIVSKAYNLKASADVKNPFKDATGIYTDAVLALYSNKVASGTTADMFGTTSEITRGQFAIFLYNVEKLGDVTAPVITLNGTADVTLDYGAEYTDAGATATDKVDGPVEVKTVIKDAAGKVVDKIDTKVPGKYTVTYTATDKSSNTAEATRTVTVKEDSAAAITSVTALEANKVRVNFAAPISDVDHTNFSVSGGLLVVKATLSADKKSVDLELGSNATAQMEYTVTATGIKNAAGVEANELKGTFVYKVTEGTTISLEKPSLNINDESGLVIKDVNGKEIKDAVLELTSTNNNIVTVSGDSVSNATVTAKAEGTAEVTVKASLKDGSVITQTFKLTIAKQPENVVSQGFTLVDDLNPASASASVVAAPANTVAFNKLASKVTYLYSDNTTTGKKVAAFDVKNGNPEVAAIDFTGAEVRNLTPTVAMGNIDSGEFIVKAADEKVTGKASFEITFADKTKRTFTVDVKAKKALKDIKVDTTSIKLSDEQLDTGAAEEGVTTKTVAVSLRDQYDKSIVKPTEFGKVTVSSNTTGLTVGGVDATNQLTVDTDGKAEFTVTSIKDKIVSGQVKVNYFAKVTDTQPTSTKTITVNVVDVDPAKAVKSSLDVVASTAIDADPTNADLLPTAIDYSSTNDADVYILDQNGNRIDKVTTGVSAELPETKKATDWVNVATNTLTFDANAVDYLSQAGTVKVNVKADGITSTQTVQYKNSKVVPHKATVATTPVAIKLKSTDSTGLSVEDILFGKIDADQILTDTNIGTNPAIMAVKQAAKNAGYLYNKPVVSVLDANNKALSTGAGVYGLAAAATSANVWDVNLTDGSVTTNGSFDIDASVVNWKPSVDSKTAPTSSTDKITLSADESVTFTVVVKSITTANDDDTHKDANLLAAPVSFNVTLTK